MNNIIKIEEIKFEGEAKRTVNARELHKFLEVQSKFADWIKNRIGDFIDDVDFVKVSKILETSKGYQIEYYLTIETAKHIAMIERNDKGREIRDYFIAVEKELKGKSQTLKLPTTIELAQMVIQAEQEKEKLKLELEEQNERIEHQNNYIKKAAPKLELYNKMQNAEGLLSLSNAGLALHLYSNKFIARIESLGYFKYRASKAQTLIAKSDYIHKGYFEVKSFPAGLDGKIRQQTVVTAKGLCHFREMVNTVFADIVNKADKKKYPISLAKANEIAKEMTN